MTTEILQDGTHPHVQINNHPSNSVNSQIEPLQSLEDIISIPCLTEPLIPSLTDSPISVPNFPMEVDSGENSQQFAKDPLDEPGTSFQSTDISTPQKSISTLKNSDLQLLSHSTTSETTLPSPFKQSLIWPEEKKVSTTTRKAKDKVPSVVTSVQWQQYMKKKQDEKDRAEQAKSLRKIAREEKKKEKEYLMSMKRKRKLKNKWKFEESDCDSTSETYSLQESDVSAEELNESTIIYPATLESLKRGEYVMVEFIGGKRSATLFHYACIIQDIDKNDISVMYLKCIDNKKTVFIPNDKDVSTIKYSEILGVLTAPKLQVVDERLRYVFDTPLLVK